jgi:hypothetical protein
MATRNSYADYLKTIPAGAVGANGLLGGPSSGVNYQAEGMTPEQYYAFMTQQVGDPMARDGADGGMRDRGPADASWVGGAQKTGASGEFFGALAAALGGQALMGNFGAAGAELGATASPVAGGTGAMGTALPELAAIGGEGVAGLGGLESGLGAFPSAMGTETGFGMGFGSSGVGAGIEGYGGITGALLPSGVAPTLMEKASGLLKDNPTLAKVGGAALGALSAKDSQTSASQSKDPWAPAQPYLLDNLKTNAAMQEHYRANPFSNEQKTAYQGLLDTVANNRANSAPMMANANSFMQSSRGRTPAMQGLLSGTQAAPIDWSQYANIGRK